MASTSIIIAGFGGQGILFIGKVLAYMGLVEEKELSWLPSYGPEMRGGTCNCNVIIADDPVGSPIISEADVLIAMNLPSLDKFEPYVKKGGKIFVDSTLVERKVARDDVEAFYIPATKMAGEMNVPTLANMIILGNVIKNCSDIPSTHLEDALKKVISSKHADMLEVNKKALQAGMDL